MFAETLHQNASPIADPLVATIAAYRAGLVAYNNRATGDLSTEALDQLAEETFGAPMHKLEAWPPPALSLEAVIEALKVAVDENEDFSGSDLSARMVAVALAYFDPTYSPRA
ncbi:hypothetical protein [Paradevosia shaoguanensis]|uniref:Uncharacterized protein n=1 Tax=Paradevosia shaoguanensis TaxID=1335043 RepID=A0AA41UF72_9HYPH|nr:hypothetical protein [Paradevosia shaoguanensis]MCF1744756.1 hypothetical protein [Paradevosia shaoguanensis]MCI0129239.1 hypothetical protein [Paradevosia shaoguanensis]